MDSRTIARPAAAVVLGRQAEGAVEHLFVKRPATMRFLAGFHSFPGGAVHPEDHSPEAFARSLLSTEEAAIQMGADAGDIPALAYYICALRELFEEVGILFATTEPPLELLSDMRRRLVEGAAFPALLAEAGLLLDTKALRFRERWLAPASLPVRFDLRVFHAAARGQVAPDPREVERVDWFSPSEVMALAESGSVLLAPPTVATIDSIRGRATLAEFLEESAGTDGPHVQTHSPLVRRLVAPNSSVMTGPGSNSYIVGSGGLVVIDPGSMDPSHLHTIAGLGPISAIVVTHGHPDHFSGALDLKDMTGAELVLSQKLWESSSLGKSGRPARDGERVHCAGADLVVLETPGHSSDHLCLWLEEESALFSGDLILGEGTTVISPPDGDLSAYLDSLHRVAALGVQRIYPGHFDPRDDGAAWIEWYISHRLEREDQILSAILDPATPTEIAARVYAQYPPALLPVAERSVLAHLIKLVAEGRATEQDGRFVAINSYSRPPPLD